MRRSSISILIFAALFSTRASAYNEAVHRYLTQRALSSRASSPAPLAAPTRDQLDAFRARFWLLASQTRETQLRAEFLARFPTAAALDAASFKELLMLNPAARVHGFDVASGPAAPTLAELLPLASRWPDDDRRNRDRFQRDAKGEILRGPDGLPLPFDPATLALGGLTGSSSQGHAHYGLLRGPLSDEVQVLQNDPRHFAIPPDVRSWGAQFSQLYTDLALVAHGSNLPSRGWLEAAFAGAAFHHLEDLANQIHTIQIGIYDFFASAWNQSKLRDLETVGGVFGKRASLFELGLHIVSNHHLLLEDLFAKRVLEEESGHDAIAQLKPLLARLDEDDPEFATPARAAMAEARSADLGPGPIQALAYELIDQSSREGAECYRLIWRISAPTLRDGAGYPYDGAKGDDPDRFIIASGADGQETLQNFYALEAKGARRATTAVRLWEEAWNLEAEAAGADQRAVDRILRLVLPYQREAAARRAAWHPATADAAIAWSWPLGALSLIAIAFLIASVLLARKDARAAIR